MEWKCYHIQLWHRQFEDTLKILHSLSHFGNENTPYLRTYNIIFTLLFEHAIFMCQQKELLNSAAIV